MRCLKPAVLTAALLVAAAPVQAVVTTFSGSGVLDTKGGSLPSSGLTPVGSRFAFSFDFDLAQATPFEVGVDESIYDLPVSNFSATLGTYSLSLAREPLYVPFVLISRGFSFFNYLDSEPSLFYTFYFSSMLVDGGSPPTPFQLSNGSRIFLQIAASFGADNGQDVLGLDRVIDPAGAVDTSFYYSARDVATRKSGFVQGHYTGGFTANSAVPEPSVWMMMIMGFGAAGAALRGRMRAVTYRVAASSI